MSVKELEEGEILDDSIGNSDDEGEVKEVSHIDIYRYLSLNLLDIFKFVKRN